MRIDCGLCVIRDWSPSDKSSLIAAANNRNVWRNLHDRFPYPYTDANATAWFATLSARPKLTQWAIEVNGCAVGGVGIDMGDGIDAKTGKLGYWLDERYWGQGIMTAAIQAISGYALSHYDLVRIEARVFAWNPASMRVLEKVGFTQEGLLRKSAFKDGQLIDQAIYALVR